MMSRSDVVGFFLLLSERGGKDYKMKKILLGGSPCTYWSIAQTKNREIKAEGLGWELFKNYLIAKEKFNPDLFLYENNKSAATAIKEQISKELGVELMHINSALVSAQQRQRFYAFNWNADIPEDRNIILSDILENGEDLSSNNKSYCLTASYGGAVPYNTLKRKQRTMVATPVRVGTFGTVPSQGRRIYSIDGKSVCICANGGGDGAHTGLYAIPHQNTSSLTIYTVKNGFIEIKGELYPIKLTDGEYIIRKLSPIECERLQTLPDNYTAGISNAQRYKCLGNGWTAEVIIHLLKAGLKNISKKEKIIVLSLYDGIATGRYCLEKLGFKNVTYYAYEIDKYAIKVAKSNFPDIIQKGDAFNVRQANWKL